jgi:ABC-2 type transport system ATP-binding protein
VLELVDLSRRYGETVALDGLSLQAEEGRLLGFVGPNGAGKTTAMRIALGVLEPDAGDVSWQGRPVRREEQRGFGYMPEERGLYPKMRADRQLRYLAELHGRPAADAEQAVTRWTERLGLGEQAEKPVEELSLGNQQRVQLAAALVHDPRLLILDEPFSGLDPIGTEVMSEVLRERAAEGVAVIFSSHQLDLVERLCDDVAIVNRGRIVAAGAVEELRTERSRPRLRVQVEPPDGNWLSGVPGAELVGREDGTVLVELGEGADDQLVLDAARRAGRVRLFEPARPTLAELFREVVER